MYIMSGCTYVQMVIHVLHQVLFAGHENVDASAQSENESQEQNEAAVDEPETFSDIDDAEVCHLITFSFSFLASLISQRAFIMLML